MNRENFIVKVQPKIWDGLGLDDPLRRKTALSALYNGYGMEQLRTLMTQSMDSKECRELREVAEFIGLRPADDIVRIEHDHHKRENRGASVQSQDQGDRDRDAGRNAVKRLPVNAKG
jgi:hypothetical protein